ncbi:MAG: hypothetical protein ACOYY2_00585, partial [Actinomycetota bacterium]
MNDAGSGQKHPGAIRRRVASVLEESVSSAAAHARAPHGRHRRSAHQWRAAAVVTGSGALALAAAIVVAPHLGQRPGGPAPLGPGPAGGPEGLGTFGATPTPDTSPHTTPVASSTPTAPVAAGAANTTRQGDAAAGVRGGLGWPVPA